MILLNGEHPEICDLKIYIYFIGFLQLLSLSVIITLGTGYDSKSLLKEMYSSFLK